MQWDPRWDAAAGVAFLLVVICFLGYAVFRAMTRRKERRTRVTQAFSEMGHRPMYCFCGQPAERAASRTGEPTWLDDLLPWWRRVSLEAQYKPDVPVDGIPTLCMLHGRAWDARLQHKVVEVVALAKAELHRTIAERMAAYEGGELAQELEGTLTALQKKERSKLTANRAKPDGVPKVVILSPDAFAPGGIAPDPVLDGPPPAMVAAGLVSGVSPVPSLTPAKAEEST